MMMMMVMMERKEGGGAKQAPTRERGEREGHELNLFLRPPCPRFERRGRAARAGGRRKMPSPSPLPPPPPLHRFLRRGWEMLDPLCAASPLSLSTMIEF